MELLKKIQELVNFLLRYVVAGGSAILAFGLTQQHPFSFLTVGTEISPVLLILFVAVIGPAIYSIHRAALHPTILVFVFWILSLKKELKIDDVPVGREWRKLDRKLAETKEDWVTDRHRKGLLATYEVWAAQVHYLYCSAFGAAFALAIASGFIPQAKNLLPILLVAVTLLLAALISDWRITSWKVERAVEQSATSHLTGKTTTT